MCEPTGVTITATLTFVSKGVQFLPLKGVGLGLSSITPACKLPKGESSPIWVGGEAKGYVLVP